MRTHFFDPFWSDIVTGRDTLLPRLTEALQAMGSVVDATKLRNYWFANDAQVDHAILNLLGRMREEGHRIMLATNQDHSRAAYLMDTLQLGDHCDGIYYSAELGVAKPDPTFFAQIAERENRRAGDMVLIDDTLKNILAARQSGWRALHYERQSTDAITAWVNGDAGSANPSTTSK